MQGWARSARWIALPLLVVVATWFATRPNKTPDFELPPAAATTATFANRLTSLDRQIETLRQINVAANHDWEKREDLAALLVERARLTGHYEDYTAAQSALDEAFALARPGGGPHLVQASTALAVHQLDRATRALNAVDRYGMTLPLERADQAALRGDVAMYRGQLDQARRFYVDAARIAPDASILYRQAILAWKTGRSDEAERAFAAAYKGSNTPNAAMQWGAMALERGDYDKAAKLFDAAKAMMPGDWRTEMRIAQLKALRGDRAAAIKDFEAIANRTGAPEPMDIVAGLYRAQGNADASRIWAERAGALWTKRLEQLPEAAWGHALEHELAFGDPKAALVFAARNYRARPYGESLVGLAKAWLALGRADYAHALIARVNASGWVGVEQHLVDADALALLGRGADAEAARQAALALNPRALDRNPAFVWLSH